MSFHTQVQHKTGISRNAEVRVFATVSISCVQGGV